MDMSLTKQDLTAIQHLIDTGNSRLETSLKRHFDEKIDGLSTDTAMAFNDVYPKLDAIKDTVERIDRVQQTELGRNDNQDKAIKRMRENLHAV
jgi:hypothetical protein